jgi:hypothetical protein
MNSNAGVKIHDGCDDRHFALRTGGLLLRRRRGGVIRGWQQWLDGHQAVERGALLRCEVRETLGVQYGLTLPGGKLAEAAEGAHDVAALIGREIGELLCSGADLYLLGGIQALDGFVEAEDALTFFRAHGLKASQCVAHVLLCSGRQVAETRFGFECPELLLVGEVGVLLHPLGKMIAATRMKVSDVSRSVLRWLLLVW